MNYAKGFVNTKLHKNVKSNLSKKKKNTGIFVDQTLSEIGCFFDSLYAKRIFRDNFLYFWNY